MVSRIIYLIVLSLVFWGCDKEYFQWNLDKVYSLPAVNTIRSSNVNNTGATIFGETILDGGSIITQRGFCFSTNQNPTIADNTTNNGTGIGTFTSSLTNLNVGTTYYIRAYAINEVGTAYGNQISLTTTNISAAPPILTTSSASGISTNSVTSGGTITSDGGSAVTQRGVCWSTNPNPTIANNIVNSGTGIGSFTSTLTNLNATTSYYARAYAINGVGTAYGNQISFTTPTPVAVSVGNNTCASLNGITSLYNGMNGTSAPWGLSGTGYSGTCWVAPDPNNSGQLGTVVGANHYVQFNRNFLSQGYIEFWVNTSNPGYNNLIPVIAVNGSGIGNATMIGGQQSSFYWMKVRSPIIPAGNNTIKILLSGSYYVLKIDEIEFFEY